MENLIEEKTGYEVHSIYRKSVYSIYDVKACTYTAPFIADTDDEARRIFNDMIVHGDNLIARHPEDYNVYVLAQFDQKSGLLSSCVKELIETGAKVISDLKKKTVNISKAKIDN